MMEREETAKSRTTLNLPSIVRLKLPMKTKKLRSASTGTKLSTYMPNAVRFADSEGTASFDGLPTKVAIENLSRSTSWTPENTTAPSQGRPQSLDQGEYQDTRPNLSRRFTTKSTKAISKFIFGRGIKLKSMTDLVDKRARQVGPKTDQKGCRKKVMDGCVRCVKNGQCDDWFSRIEDASSTRGSEGEPSIQATQTSGCPHSKRDLSSGAFSSSTLPSFSISNRITLTIHIDLPLPQLFVAGILQYILARVCPPSWLIQTAGVGMGVVYAVLAVVIAYLPWVVVDRQDGLERHLTV